MKDNLAYWHAQLIKVKQCSQRQDSLNNQLKDLILIANKFGFMTQRITWKNS